MLEYRKIISSVWVGVQPSAVAQRMLLIYDDDKKWDMAFHLRVDSKYVP